MASRPANHLWSSTIQVYSAGICLYQDSHKVMGLFTQSWGSGVCLWEHVHTPVGVGAEQVVVVRFLKCAVVQSGRCSADVCHQKKTLQWFLMAERPCTVRERLTYSLLLFTVLQAAMLAGTVSYRHVIHITSVLFAHRLLQYNAGSVQGQLIQTQNGKL